MEGSDWAVVASEGSLFQLRISTQAGVLSCRQVGRASRPGKDMKENTCPTVDMW